jgi:hypothetical protein
MVALLKIDKLHVAVNSRMDSFIEATKQASDARFTDLTQELLQVRHRNDQLFDQLTEVTRILAGSPGPLLNVERFEHQSEEKPPCTV